MTNYKIEVINMRNCKDFGKRSGDFRIDRKTQWGNPFTLDKYSRDESIRLYEDYFKKDLIGKISQLATANRLGCWCAPKRCHGEIIRKYLIEYLEGLEKQMTLDGKVLYYKDPERE